MNRCLAAVLVLGFLTCFVSGEAIAQEEEGTDLTWGIVSSVSSTQITVKEYDYSSGEELDVVYVLQPNTELQGVDSLENIAVGDNIEIEYILGGDDKVAKGIIIEKPSLLEEDDEE
ncbi:MAG: hypothetical protein ABH914_01075 [Candidatus Omnitrophota bacterium]